jgi:hypothetical protein
MNLTSGKRVPEENCPRETEAAGRGPGPYSIINSEAQSAATRVATIWHKNQGKRGETRRKDERLND